MTTFECALFCKVKPKMNSIFRIANILAALALVSVVVVVRKEIGAS